jgi:hypothetical protein
MMTNKLSLLVLFGAAVMGHTHAAAAATSHQRKSDVPDLIWSVGKSANEEIACQEQTKGLCSKTGTERRGT